MPKPAKEVVTWLELKTKQGYTGHMSPKMPSKVCAYIRVSTQRQGVSGLGLAAQQEAIKTFCKARGLTLLREYREVESGRHNDRPVLADAIRYAKSTKSLLLIAKLDRLARSVAFIANLMESVDFRAADYPDDDPFMLHIRAAVAEDEGRRIGRRITEALAAAKRRGTKLGASNPRSRNLTRQAARKGSRTVALKAAQANAEATAIAAKLRDKGLSLAAIGKTLDERGIYTRSGGSWKPMQVLRILRRAE